MAKGRFGKYGGQYVPETVMPVLNEIEAAYAKYKDDPEFLTDFHRYLREYAGRPTLLYYAKKLTEHYGKAKIFLKREDLLHTGAHKINNALGQAILAKRMGKKCVIAETGAGQHGVATATVAALFGFKCKVFMGELDVERQKLNVFRMKLLGAEVVPVKGATGTLKDAMNEAIRYWSAHIDDTYYIIGTVAGPAPYPELVRDFQKVIGEEVRQQIMEQSIDRVDYLIACVGGGSNSMGLFYEFRNDKNVKKIGIEAAGKGVDTDEHAMSIEKGRPGVLHGAYSYLLQDDDGQALEAYSVSAGLDYPGVGPEHSYFADEGIAEYVGINDKEAIDALCLLTRLEGIIPAVESSHALAYLEKLLPNTSEDEVVVVCLSGRGDKDMPMVAKILGEDIK